MQKKLFYVIDDGNDFSVTVPEKDLADIIKVTMEEYNKDTPDEELPVFTVSPIYMTQEEFDNMPEYQG